MGESAEKMAKINAIPREQQDQFALRSHRLAAAGTQDGRLTAEIVPVFVPPSFEAMTSDNGIRSDTLDRAARARSSRCSIDSNGTRDRGQLVAAHGRRRAPCCS